MKAYYYGVLPFVFLLCSCALEGGVPGPAGGYVFYDKGEYSDDWRYLECAPEDAGGDVSWGEAKTLCEGYASGGYEDWYLPSTTELQWMYTNLHKKGMGNFKAGHYDRYWSSEGLHSGNYIEFSDGDVDYGSSSSVYHYHVRPVRKF